MPLPSGSAEITSDNQPGLCLTVFSRLDIIWIIRGEHPLTQCFKRTACSRGANAFNLIKGKPRSEVGAMQEASRDWDNVWLLRSLFVRRSQI